MKLQVQALSALCVFWAGSAIAQSPDGFEKIYEAPTHVNLGGRPVVADIALYTDREAAQDGDLHVALVTDVTKFIAETEQDLENWIAANQKRCGERWGSGDPFIGFPPDQIRFALYLELEVWNCGWNGKSDPSLFAQTGGEVDVTLDAYVEDGKLQTSLAAFSIDERSGVTKYLPLEFVTRRVINAELRKLNENERFYKAPKPFIDEGFRYKSIDAEKTGDQVVITARYVAEGSEDVLERLVEQVREEGITQPKRSK